MKTIVKPIALGCVGLAVAAGILILRMPGGTPKDLEGTASEPLAQATELGRPHPGVAPGTVRESAVESSGRRVQGSVFHEAGVVKGNTDAPLLAPSAYCKVCWRLVAGSFIARTEGNLESSLCDENGGFVIDLPPLPVNDNWEAIEIWAVGSMVYMSDKQEVALPLEGMPSVRLVRQLIRPLNIHVTDEFGVPVDGAAVGIASRIAGDPNGEVIESFARRVSKDDSLFVCDECGDIMELSVVAPGFEKVVIGASHPSVGGKSRRSPIRVVLKRTAPLRVTVLEAGGGAAEGVSVGVRLQGVGVRKRAARRVELDDNGEAFFEGIPKGEVVVDILDRDMGAPYRPIYTFDRVRDGVAEIGQSKGSESIRIEEKAMHLTVLLGDRRRISGRVVAPDGSPAGGAWVSVCAMQLGGPRLQLGMVPCDAGGRYGVSVLLPAEGVLDVAVHAAQGRFYLPPGTAVGWGEVKQAAGDAVLNIELKEPATIEGRVVSASGHGVAAQLEVRPIEAGAVNCSSWGAGFVVGESKSNGEFEVGGLYPGRYAVKAIPRGGKYASANIKSVVAGGSQFCHIVVEPGGAKVTMDVDASAFGVGVAGVRYMWLGPIERGAGNGVSSERLSSISYASPEGWFPGVKVGLVSQRVSTAHGAFDVDLVSRPLAPWSLFIEPGLWYFGVVCELQDGSLSMPVGTGLVEVLGGEHRVRFAPNAGVAFQGIVQGLSPLGHLFCSFHDANGKLLLVVGNDGLIGSMVRVDALGQFRAQVVPCEAAEVRFVLKTPGQELQEVGSALVGLGKHVVGEVMEFNF